MRPERVPEVLKTPINFKVIGIIFAGVIGLQSFLYLTQESGDVEEGIAFLSMSLPLVVAICSFFVAHRYGLSQVFGKSYLMFSLAYFVFFLAEMTYYAYDVIYGIDPYPSFADIFFFAFYPLTAMHIIINLRFFKSKTTTWQKILFIAIPAVIFSAYTITASEAYGGIEEIILDDEATFDYLYGLIFVAVAAITLSLAALGAIVFRGGMLGIVWVLLLVGILINNIGDVWYYYLELFGGFDLYHPVNLFWYSSSLIMIYALYKHIKSI
ncbi:MAG TPA: histidine kinase [Nitrosopumilaceae archaeon]|nr:histidine kinase [Nitrosopumilaceae archaeon]